MSLFKKKEKSTVEKKGPAKKMPDIFINKDKVAITWFLLFLLVVIGWAVDRQILIKDLLHKPQFFIMDAATTYYLPSSLDFEEAKDIHSEQTRLVMESMFDRGPNGPDHKKRLKLILSQTAYREAIKLINKEADQFLDQKIHQKVEIGDIRILKTDDNSVITACEAQILRNGIFEGKSFTRTIPVRAKFLFKLNQRMRTNGRFPTVAVKFVVEFGEKRKA